MVNVIEDYFFSHVGKVFQSESPIEINSDMDLFLDLGWELISFFTTVTLESPNIIQSSNGKLS